MASGRIAELWRYPVKSMGGARVTSARLQRRGLHADRLWAVRDLERDLIASARRLPALLGCTARYAAVPGPGAGPGDVPAVLVTLPGGDEVSSDDPGVHAALSAALERDVRLEPLGPGRAQQRLGVRQGLSMASVANIRRELAIAPDEPLPDLTRMRLREVMTLARYATPPGALHDLSPVHLLTRTSLDTIAGHCAGSQVEPRRFRPTMLLDVTDPVPGSLPEADWSGRRLDVGAAGLEVVMPTVRCSMPGRPQPGLERDPGITRAVAVHADRFLGAYADVVRDGVVAVGDPVTLHTREPAGVVRRSLGTGRRTALRGASAVLSRFS